MTDFMEEDVQFTL